MPSAAALWCAVAALPGPAAAQALCDRCPIVLISIDTLRADRLGCYGYWRPTSPRLDAFAATAVRYARAHATSYVTADSHMSVFTSLYPSVHGVRNANGGTIMPLAPEIVTFPELLARSGYVTGAVTGGGNISGAYGFDRSMQMYEVIFPLDQAARRARDFVKRHSGGPFFLFLHTYHVHDPYTPSAWARRALGIEDRPDRATSAPSGDVPFWRRRDDFWKGIDPGSARDVQWVSDLYDAEILEADVAVGEFIDWVRARVPDALIVVMSDHGEQFQEHGRFLHSELYEELLRVPLILQHPALRPGVVNSPVSLVDLAPTLMAAVGLPVPGHFQGRSLPSPQDAQEPARPIFAEKAGRTQSLVWMGNKIIRDSNGSDTTFDLVADRRERWPLHESEDERPRLLKAMLEEQIRDNAVRAAEMSPSPVVAHPLLPRLLESLRALGYAQ